MTDRLCLRCDWRGITRDRTCPTCGEPLYAVPAPNDAKASASGGHAGRGQGDVPATVPSLAEERSRDAAGSGRVAPSAPVEPTRRARGFVAFVVGALVVALVLGTWLDTHRHGRITQRAQPAAPGLVGTLVYAVRENGGSSRVYLWDLASGRVERGPRVPRVVELVNGDGANFGWVGTTSVLPDGHLMAGVLRFLGPNDQLTPIIRGDMISWGPRGDSVVAVHRGPERPICRRRVSIVWARLVPEMRERQFLAPHLCGDVWSVGRDENVTYFTLVRGGRMDIVYAGLHRVHEVLARRALLSVSPLSDLLVVNGDAFRAAGKGPVRPDGPPIEVSGAELYFRGLQRRHAIVFGTAGARFSLDRVLAWSPNALTAITTGRLGLRTGLFELRAGPAPGPRAPRYLGPDPGIAYATYAEDGTAIVVTADGLFIDRGGSLVRLAPPAGAPSVEGPIAWIR